MHWDAIKQVEWAEWGPSGAKWGAVLGAEWGRVGPVGLGGVDDLGPSGGAEWGWAIQLNSVRAEWGRVVGEGLGMHWIQLNYSKTRPWLRG